MKLQRLMSVARKAIDDYEMIQEGDKIAIGISGGKDSLALLYALHGLKQFYPKKFEIIAISVHLGYCFIKVGAFDKARSVLEACDLDEMIWLHGLTTPREMLQSIA